MPTNNTRRKILKLASASTVLGFTSNVSASSEANSVRSRESLRSDTTTAISIQNNSTSTEEVVVNVVDSERTASFAQAARFSASVEPGARTTFSASEVDIGGGTYEIEVGLVDRDVAESTTWKLPSGGVNGQSRISAHVKPDSSVKLYREEL